MWEFLLLTKIVLTNLSESGQSVNHQSFSYLRNTKPFHRSVLLSVKGRTFHVYLYLRKSDDESIHTKCNFSETWKKKVRITGCTFTNMSIAQKVSVNQVYWYPPPLSLTNRYGLDWPSTVEVCGSLEQVCHTFTVRSITFQQPSTTHKAPITYTGDH